MFIDQEMLAILGVSLLSGGLFYLVAAIHTGVFSNGPAAESDTNTAA